MAIATLNPFTGETVRTFEPLSHDNLEAKLRMAAQGFERHRRTSYADRAACLTRAAEILEGEQREFGRLMTLEMGKPIKAAREEAAKCAWACRYYAENGERFLSDEEVPTNATRSYVRFQPIGPVLAIMPWNFPFWQVFRFAAPALMAGNVGLLKHASNVPQCALAIEDILLRAGFGPGAFQTLLIGSDIVERVIDDSRIKAVTLTGSEYAGIDVAQKAGKRLKKTVLELGGSDPFIVMPSADIEESVTVAVRARTINNGQSCIAAKRFLVHEAIADRFEEQFVQAMQSLKIGDPADEGTELGPLATESILESLHEQVMKSIELGAKLLTGGSRLDRRGFFYAPTALTDIPKKSPAYSEELFGPVAALFRVRDIDEALRIANDSSFGLGASAWTQDKKEEERFIAGIESGLVFINSMVASDPRLPFGGVKNSGYGRELSVYGIREFTNIKTVSIRSDNSSKMQATE
jgi:succinate-semialdehyde dehydrogenase/glutarate-semialdehyde dehydrogenase